MVLASGDEVDLIGGGASGEGEDDPREDQGHARAGGEAGLDEPVAVGEGGGQARALVGDPPQAVLAGEDDEAPVEVGVVIDVEVPAAADDEGLVRADPVHLAGEVEHELLGAVGVDGGQ